jgi:hypothetical protein
MEHGFKRPKETKRQETANHTKYAKNRKNEEISRGDEI